MQNFPNWMQNFKLDIRFPTVDQIPNYIYLQLDQEGIFLLLLQGSNASSCRDELQAVLLKL